MKSAISSRPTRSGRAGVRLVAMALTGGLLMILSAAFGATAFNGDDSGVAVENARHTLYQAMATRPLSEPPDVVYYLVASEVDRVVVQAWLAEAEATESGSVSMGQTRYVILDASDAAKEADAAWTIGEAMALGIHSNIKVEVFDMRNQGANALRK